MKDETNTDRLLQDALLNIKDSKSFVSFVFNYCETQEDRKKMLSYIRNGNDDRKQVLLMASKIAIENGTSEGELEDEE